MTHAISYTTENSTSVFCWARQQFILWTLTQCSPQVSPVTRASGVSPQCSVINGFLWLEKADGLAGKNQMFWEQRRSRRTDSWLRLPEEPADLSHRRGLIATSHSVLTDNMRKTERERRWTCATGRRCQRLHAWKIFQNILTPPPNYCSPKCTQTPLRSNIKKQISTLTAVSSSCSSLSMLN